MNQKTTLSFADKNEATWYHIDATGLIVGRLAVQISTILRGKHKPSYTPFNDNGDYVVVTNVEKLVFTGNKANAQMYRHHTLYPGGLKEISFREMNEKHPDRVLKEAVRRMMPSTILGRSMFKKLKIYAGTDHPHQAQQLVDLEIDQRIRRSS